MYFVSDLKNSCFVLSYGEITASNKGSYTNLRHYFRIWPEAMKKAKEYIIQDIRICSQGLSNAQQRVKHSTDTLLVSTDQIFSQGFTITSIKLRVTTDITQASTNLIHFPCVVEHAIEKVLSILMVFCMGLY